MPWLKATGDTSMKFPDAFVKRSQQFTLLLRVFYLDEAKHVVFVKFFLRVQIGHLRHLWGIWVYRQQNELIAHLQYPARCFGKSLAPVRLKLARRLAMIQNGEY